MTFFSDLKPGEILGWVSGLSTILIGIWTLISKGRETHYSRLEADRARLAAENEENKKSCKEAEAKIDDLETTSEFYKVSHKTLLEFLDDIIGGSFDMNWIKTRAEQLKNRYKL